jgi:UDP-N-acetylmuramoylalanine--D-glutamate ligase
MTLFGYGKTIQAIAKRFGSCDIFDDKFIEVTIDEFGNRLLPTHMFDPDASTLEVTSPGIAPTHPLTASAKNLISEYDLFADNMPFSIWISGTNGKTTTTQMAQFLLEKRGSAVGGNIGEPLASLDDKAPIWVLETSSFTMYYTKKAKPNIYLLLPVTPDHVTWHGSQEEYEAAKLKPFASMREGEMIIAPIRFSRVATDGFFVGYKNVDDLADYFEIDLSKIRFKGVFLFDAVMALCVTKALFDEVDYEKINSFVIDGHRQEEFFDTRGRLWIDDSKATNLDATIEAIKNFIDKKIHLILGGDDKGQDLSELFDFLKGKDIEVYSIGSNASKLESLCQKINIKCHKCDILEIAVNKISENMSENEAGLLSPAAASLDQFSSYKERGEKFKTLVYALS